LGGSAGSSEDIWGGLKNAPVKSPGCDKAATLTNGKKSIMSGGRERAYIIDIPASYDPSKPYRLFYVSHGLGGRAEDVAGPFNFFGLKPQATAAKDPAIFVAGQGLENTWGEVDHAFFDDVTTAVKNGLCIDTTRVFVTGMSMGGMYSYSLSTDRQKGFRAGVGLAPTNYNIWLPNPKLKDPIAWMQTTGNADTYCPWVANEAQKRGSKFIALEKAADNGCTIPATVPFWQSGNHICYDFEGCKPGYPVRACSFGGGHVDSNRDPGSNVNWIAEESWKFFTQF
jgi:poly(3-hydroxybutyrate) depolymerase